MSLQVNQDLSSVQKLALWGDHLPLPLVSSVLAGRRAWMDLDQLERLLHRPLAQGLFRLNPQELTWNREALHQETIRLCESHPRYVQKTVRNTFGDMLPANGLRLSCYANDGDFFRLWLGRQYDPDGALEFILPVNLPWLESREPRIRRTLLSYLYPRLLHWGALIPSLQKMIFEHPELSTEQMEIALLRGDWKWASKKLEQEPELKKAGFHASMEFLQGRRTEAHQAFVKLIGKRRSKGPLLRGFNGIFARLAALHAGDWAAVLDPRFGSDESVEGVLRQLALSMQGADQNLRVPLPEHLREGLDYTVLWSLRHLLPPGLQPAESVLPKFSEQQLSIVQQQLEGPPEVSWGYGLQRELPWRAWLQALKSQAGSTSVAEPSPKKPARSQSVLVWKFFDPGIIHPYRRTGTKDTPVSLESLVAKPPQWLSEQDERVLSKTQRSHRDGVLFVDHSTDSLRALVGHPHLVRDGRSVELAERPQQLQVSKSNQGYHLQLVPGVVEHLDVRFTFERDTIYFTPQTPAAVALQKMVDRMPPLPGEAVSELREALAPWLGVVELTYAKGTPPLFESTAAGPLVALLTPERSGLRLEWGFQPLGKDGPTMRMGTSLRSLTWQGRSVTFQRNAQEDEATLQVYRESVPSLQDRDSGWWYVDEAVVLLEELQGAGIELHWPEGKSWKVYEPVSRQQLRVVSQAEQDWFSLQGELTVGEDLVLTLAQALELARQPGDSYVALDEERFVQLTRELREQLTALDELAEEHKKGLRISAFAIPTLADLELSSLETDARFRASLDRFQGASNYHARVPAALQAELRDYQVEGFRWLAQRARAGCGACLADDMGLGKTVQTLALLVKEQAGGPHLVVCPTSVVSNWEEQIRRFAPTLQAVLYDRNLELESLTPGTVVLCSYRMLLGDAERLAGRRWNVALLDEAQYIKNPESKTARACFTLQASIRIATTGTPIENRLTELWSIFRFLNPGLLGSLASFRRRFEQNGDRRRLRRLVSPFLLRRLKSEVLSELPPRTELLLQVELSPGERALYEQLRREAELGSQDEKGRFQLLALLTRLRQACCHPALISPELKLPSSKLEALLELVDELRQNRHRALIFSQFTQLLDLVEPALEKAGVRFLRLDGSTPAAKRRELVAEFQAGEADVFLISLKAGGTGLNLTAADYVVHLDPWWNPAAEDQASDRAHRIGQTRPVTIYRLIARDTLEEKVVHLHGRKRELAQAVLEGQSGGALSVSELKELLG